jgi:hypothetical protein
MINGSTYPDGSFWKISFLSETLGTCYMVIDALDGKIITDYNHENLSTMSSAGSPPSDWIILKKRTAQFKVSRGVSASWRP